MEADPSIRHKSYARLPVSRIHFDKDFSSAARKPFKFTLVRETRPLYLVSLCAVSARKSHHYCGIRLLFRAHVKGDTRSPAFAAQNESLGIITARGKIPEKCRARCPADRLTDGERDFHSGIRRLLTKRAFFRVGGAFHA